MDPIAPVLPTVIGLAGLKGAGKDTVAAHLISMYGFTRVAFGDPLKAAIAAMFEVDPAFLEQRENKERPVEKVLGYTPRVLWQTLGTEWGRQIIDRDIWVKLANRKIRRLQDAGSSLIVVPDVRFPNEIEFFRSLVGGAVWWIHRPGENNDTHASENSIDITMADDVIHNNGTIEMLYVQVGVNFANLRRRAIRRAFKSSAV